MGLWAEIESIWLVFTGAVEAEGDLTKVWKITMCIVPVKLPKPFPLSRSL